jgi:hypothetical protein
MDGRGGGKRAGREAWMIEERRGKRASKEAWMIEERGGKRARYR